MLVLMGHVYRPHLRVTAEAIVKRHLGPLIATFKANTGIDIPSIPNIDQVLTYEAGVIAANIATNVQEHFVQKVGLLLTSRSRTS
jgi:hypothetical protein